MTPETAVSSVPHSKHSDVSDLKVMADTQLLERFVRLQDDSAFTVLVHRYGRLVYNVCRRNLQDSHDAEDAFQTTFLVLVKKAGTLHNPGHLASWLYGVAYRTACKVKAKAALRTRTERKASGMPTTSEASDMTLDELRVLLDEAISQLPEKYSLPLVLCYLEGKTNAEAAAQLGWPEGSISRRLSRARELLRSRLARRGLGPSVAIIAAVFAQRSVACVPPDLLASTVKTASLVVQGVDVADVVSPATAKLVEDILHEMSATRRLTIPAVLAVVASLFIAVGIEVWQVGTPAYGANILNFHRGASPHALTSSAGTGAVQLSVDGKPVAGAPNAATHGGCGMP